LKIKPFALPKFGGGGEPFGIMHSIFKRFALGQWAQSVAQAALQARTFITNPDDIAQVKLHVAQRAIGIMADTPDKWHPQTRETADHSLPYAAAVLLTYGTIDEHYYDNEFLHDQRLLDLVGRVQVIRWAEADRRRTETSMCELEIVLKSGSTQTVRVEYQRGHWLNPMTEAEMEEKFIALAAKQLPASRIDGLMKQLRKLEEADSVRTLVEMTSPA
jgi:2-methylcitrate dehydratase